MVEVGTYVGTRPFFVHSSVAAHTSHHQSKELAPSKTTTPTDPTYNYRYSTHTAIIERRVCVAGTYHII